MKSSALSSAFTILAICIVISVLLYGFHQLVNLLQDISTELSHFEAWLSSGMMR